MQHQFSSLPLAALISRHKDKNPFWIGVNFCKNRFTKFGECFVDMKIENFHLIAASRGWKECFKSESFKAWMWKVEICRFGHGSPTGCLVMHTQPNIFKSYQAMQCNWVHNSWCLIKYWRIRAETARTIALGLADSLSANPLFWTLCFSLF